MTKNKEMGEDFATQESDTPSPLDWEALRNRGLAVRIEDLPPLEEGYARGVHITAPELAESIVAHGLDYSRQGMLMSTANIWGDEKEVKFTSDDHRFGPGSVDIVFDLSFEETKLHNDETQAPGLIPADHIVGVIDLYKEETSLEQ